MYPKFPTRYIHAQIHIIEKKIKINIHAFYTFRLWASKIYVIQRSQCRPQTSCKQTNKHIFSTFNLWV